LKMKNKVALRERLKTIARSNSILYNIAMLLLRRKPIIGGLRKEIRGSNNIVRCSDTVTFIDSKIDIVGSNNEIRISSFSSFRNVTFLVRGNNNVIRLSEGVKFHYGGSLHIEDDHCVIDIGDHSTFENVHVAVTESHSRILIGRDCMFAYDVDVRTGDSHSILDNAGKRINPAGDVTIGDHVWVAPHCSILKGVEIRKNSIVATRSVITGTYAQEGIIIGGSPSRILKENITWDRRRLAQA
jgi:acetyltransferase-like isoleucine patch superfamily enzyme